MELKPQDVLMSLKLALSPAATRPTYAELATALRQSASEVHAAVKRAKAARLINELDRKLARIGALLEFIIHGVEYAFPAERGPLTRAYPPPMRRRR